MSGIAGIIRFDGGPAGMDHLRAMTDALAHRGPDGTAHWSSGPVALGHCMLRTTPESLEETQPLANEDESVVLVMDGRVDNWEELRGKLLDQGARLRTRADAELVLRAYERWGGDCLQHIDGDFALVLWDARRREAFCARDRMGAKPFYYHRDGERFSFASEPGAILALPWVDAEMDEAMVGQVVTYRIMSRTRTLWRGIRRLEPAQSMRVAGAGPSRQTYWSPEGRAPIRYRRIEEYSEHLGDLLARLVRRHSRSQSPLACEVSGGLDSSGVFAIAEMLRRQGHLGAPDLQGYTLRFAEGSAADEIAFARAVGTHLDRPVEEIPPTLRSMDWYADLAARTRSFPPYPNAAMSLGIYEAASANGSRVLLQGLGGDEWLTGSPYALAEMLAHGRWGDLWRTVQAERRAFGVRAALGLAGRFGVVPLLPEPVQRALRAASRAIRGHPPLPYDVVSEPIRRAVAESAAEEGISDGMPRIDAHAARRAALASGNKMFILESTEPLTAAAGIETRRPLDSAELAEFCFRTPEYSRMAGTGFRISYRLALGGALPDEVRNRQSKAEFSIVFCELVEEIAGFTRRHPGRLEGRWMPEDQAKALISRAGGVNGEGLPLWRIWGLFGCGCLAGRIVSDPER